MSKTLGLLTIIPLLFVGCGSGEYVDESHSVNVMSHQNFSRETEEANWVGEYEFLETSANGTIVHPIRLTLREERAITGHNGKIQIGPPEANYVHPGGRLGEPEISCAAFPLDPLGVFAPGDLVARRGGGLLKGLRNIFSRRSHRHEAKSTQRSEPAKLNRYATYFVDDAYPASGRMHGTWKYDGRRIVFIYKLYPRLPHLPRMFFFECRDGSLYDVSNQQLLEPVPSNPDPDS